MATGGWAAGGAVDVDSGKLPPAMLFRGRECVLGLGLQTESRSQEERGSPEYSVRDWGGAGRRQPGKEPRRFWKRFWFGKRSTVN